MSRRPTTSRLIEARATCQRCAWSVTAANAQALAAQHFDKRGHRVVVISTTEITYGAVSGSPRSDSQGSLQV